MLKHISINQRLLCGYALILGLAVAGTTVGLITGNRLQRNALTLQQAAVEEQQLLKTLRIKILENRPVKQLSPHVEDAVRFQQESQVFLNRVEAVRILLRNHNTLHDHQIHETSLDHQELHESLFWVEEQEHHRHVHSEFESLDALLHYGEKTVDQFTKHTKAFIHTINALGYSPATSGTAQKEVIQFVQSDEFQAFIELSDQLIPFIERLESRELVAEQELRQAVALRNYVIFGSLAISTAIAALIGFYTSRAIAQPIKDVTKVAQCVTKNNNFELQAPVERNDEVGRLATSLNQLITQVKQLLTEVNHKNDDLEKVLEQVRRQQTHLIQSEKMSSLGQLVAGVAHEINNPVNFIHGNLNHVQDYTQDLLALVNLYQEQYPEANKILQMAIEDYELEFIQEDLPKTLESMNIGTQRIREIVLSLRNFSRMDEADLKPVDIHDGLNNTLLLLQHRIKATPQRPEISIVRRYGDLPPIECYPGLLNQVFMNILANAIDALEDKVAQYQAEGEQGKPKCEIRLDTSLVRGDNGDGLWAKIAISDNGLGMTEETQNRLFDPFFTTKPIGKGTGMGLSIGYQVVTERHGGTLNCESTLGQGTEFAIHIPIHPTVSPHSSETLSSPYGMSLNRNKAIAQLH